MPRSSPLPPCALWLALLLPVPALAGTPTGAKAGTLDAAVLAGTCFSCHGPEGRSTGPIPALQGRSAAELRQRLQAFQRGQTPDATVMTRLMKGYDDAQVEALAQWFARKEGQ